jgi:hypothetical protein
MPPAACQSVSLTVLSVSMSTTSLPLHSLTDRDDFFLLSLTESKRPSAHRLLRTAKSYSLRVTTKPDTACLLFLRPGLEVTTTMLMLPRLEAAQHTVSNASKRSVRKLLTVFRRFTPEMALRFSSSGMEERCRLAKTREHLFGPSREVTT